MTQPPEDGDGREPWRDPQQGPWPGQWAAGSPGWAGAPGWPSPGAPYGRHPVTGEPFSDKQKSVAGLLQILPSFLGITGVGRLYAGSTGLGLTQLLVMIAGWLLCWTLILLPIGLLVVIGVWIWNFVDGVVVLSGLPRDGRGYLLR